MRGRGWGRVADKKIPEFDKIIGETNIKMPNFISVRRQMDTAINDIAKTNAEKRQREIDIANAIKEMAKAQPEMISILMALYQENEKTSKHQRRVNISIIILTALALILAIINVLFLFNILT